MTGSRLELKINKLHYCLFTTTAVKFDWEEVTKVHKISMIQIFSLAFTREQPKPQQSEVLLFNDNLDNGCADGNTLSSENHFNACLKSTETQRYNKVHFVITSVF